jgi:hypothetical protein
LLQGEDLVVSCYYIDSGMNAFAISPAQVNSGSVLASVESVIHACKFPLSTAKYTFSAFFIIISEPALPALFFFSKKKITSTCYLLAFYADPSPPDRGIIRLCSASLINNRMLCIADGISTLNESLLSFTVV